MFESTEKKLRIGWNETVVRHSGLLSGVAVSRDGVLPKDGLLQKGEAMNKEMKPVLVTTQYRGVFFGYLEDDSNCPATIDLTNARNCVYWSADCKGFLGLTATGPTSSCKIGPQVSSITLYGVTSITPVSDVAVKAWEVSPWK